MMQISDPNEKSDNNEKMDDSNSQDDNAKPQLKSKKSKFVEKLTINRILVRKYGQYIIVMNKNYQCSGVMSKFLMFMMQLISTQISNWSHELCGNCKYCMIH